MSASTARREGEALRASLAVSAAPPSTACAPAACAVGPVCDACACGDCEAGWCLYSGPWFLSVPSAFRLGGPADVELAPDCVACCFSAEMMGLLRRVRARRVMRKERAEKVRPPIRRRVPGWRPSVFGVSCGGDGGEGVDGDCEVGVGVELGVGCRIVGWEGGEEVELLL